jgi:ribosomal protein S18 acetylase RimI-like enzyme
VTAGIDVRPLAPDDADACDRIVLGLPYHFGHEGGRRDCAAAVRSHDGLVAEVGGEVVGFLTWQRRFEEAAEITWMAVRRDHRGAGIGRALVDALVARLRDDRIRLLIVLTVSPNDPDEPDPDDGGYEATRAFYRSVGFVTARDLPREWPGDLAALFARPL